MVICNREFQRFAFRHPQFVRYGESKAAFPFTLITSCDKREGKSGSKHCNYLNINKNRTIYYFLSSISKKSN